MIFLNTTQMQKLDVGIFKHKPINLPINVTPFLVVVKHILVG